jgi:two-component system CheB/CheR fusion protein
MTDSASHDGASAETVTAQDEEKRGEDAARLLHVVGVGASAGGLEALETFFDEVPPHCGMAFVVVQHLSPDFESMMDELLARHTKMAVHRVKDGVRVEPDSVYLLPPKKEMIIQDGQLLLSDKDPSQGLSLPIDTFFRSLAQDAGERAVGVILSGTGSDGSRGIQAIHNAGGLVIAQSEETAKFDGMPKAAIETGIVDIVLPPEMMADALGRFVSGQSPVAAAVPDMEAGGSAAGDAMQTIFTLLRLEHGIDFSWYKKSTVIRRIERRLQLLRSDNLDEYVERLRTDIRERNQLYQDLLIGVTKFFRDTEAFDILAREVLPGLLERVPPGGEARFWIAGCATGEEAYSLAILVREQLDRIDRPVEVKIFATDVHRTSLDFARGALYGPESLSQLSPERIDRNFIQHGKRYQVSPELRKFIVFAPHNVIKDAPFTKIDLISCRNLLIYLEPAAQQKVLSLFHFALNTGGALFLGSSESPAEMADEFEPINRHWKIFRKRREVPLRSPLPLGLPSGLRDQGHRRERPASTDSEVERHVTRASESLIADHCPASFLVDDRHQLLYTFPGAQHFLQIRDGQPSCCLLDLVGSELRVALAGALQRCARQRATVTFTGVRVEPNERQPVEQVKLIVKPLLEKDDTSPHFLVSLTALHQTDTVSSSSARDSQDDNTFDWDEVTRQRFETLETELRHTRENLQATIEELEASNEELQATNEELVASNEELQSTNQELHSVNEELYTVNAEHQKKIDELTELTDDMDNLFRATDIGTIFLDEQLCIRKFTPHAARNFQILPQDIGRRIDSFSHNLAYRELFDDIRQVARGDLPNVQRDVVDNHGTWYFLRMLPYCSRKDAGGVLLSLVDISALKATQHELHVAYDALNSSLNATVIADFDWEIQYANSAFSDMFGLDQPGMLKGRRLSELFVAENVKRLTEICSNLDEDPSAPLEYSIQRPDGSLLAVDVRSCVVSDGNGKARGRMVSFIDITRRKCAEEQREAYARELESANATLRRAEREARTSVENRDRFLATLSHELRNPLGGLLNAQHVLEHGGASTEHRNKAATAIKRQAEHMSHLLNDLLDVTRVTKGKIEFQRQEFDIRELIPETVEAVATLIHEKRQRFQIDQPEDPLPVEGDRVRLRQVMENLLSNAAKYTPPHGRIDVLLSQSNQHCVLRVRDSGRGIRSELLDRIFDMFFQADETLDRLEGGMGVGLTLVRSLVEMHGGTVTAHSAGEGKGAEFTVTLPLSKTATTEPNRAGTTEAESDTHEARVDAPDAADILLIEDNADSREMLQTLLELLGHQVQVAEDGKSGLDRLLSDPPDIALIDIGIPEFDGYEVARRARQYGKDRDVILVALTGYGQQKDRAAAVEAGFDDHLVKPVDLNDLNRVLARATDRR